MTVVVGIFSCDLYVIKVLYEYMRNGDALFMLVNVYNDIAAIRRKSKSVTNLCDALKDYELL